MRIRTGYSFRNAYGPIEEVFAATQRVHPGYAPITDRASTFGFVRWDKLCKKAGVKPIFGVELAVVQSLTDRKTPTDYWTFIATDDVADVFKILKLATDQFYYEAKITYEQANAVKGLTKLVGRRALLDLVDASDGMTFFGASPSCSFGYTQEALRRMSPVACSDNFYPTASDEDRNLYEIVTGRGKELWPQHILPDDEWRENVSLSDESKAGALRRRFDYFNRATAQLRMGKLYHPPASKSLLSLCVEGAKRTSTDLTDPIYKARLTRELELIADRQFEDYFFVIADICQWARQRMIVGPARGSSCGSLVCYLLNITTVDPIKYGLLFERFIDINRKDLPDIDIDFSDSKRHLVFEYMEQKYGKDHIARLGTVALYRPKSALSETANTLKIPLYKFAKVVENLITRPNGDARVLNTLLDTLDTTDAGKAFLIEYPEMKIAARLEGQPNHHSQHAAGIILTEEPVINLVGVDGRTGATHCDKKDAEELNLLKIDALGLTQLSVFEDALELAKLPMNHLETISLNDPKAFAVLNDGKFAGIFQFAGRTLTGLTQQVKVESLEDIVSITSLARPGPMASGGANEWALRKSGKAEIRYQHKSLEPILKDTLGVVTYQEQVMRIGRDIGGLSWEEVSELRKAMSKSLGKEHFDKFGVKFKSGAQHLGMDAFLLDKIWDDLCAHGSWSFNRSHAVAYGIVSYWCCWLKAHYPLEFAAATLQHESAPEKQIMLLRELDAEGIGYVPVDIVKSKNKWTVGSKDGRDVLIGPISNVKGIGPVLMKEIESSLARGEPMPKKALKILANPVTNIDSLWPVRERVLKKIPDLSEVNIRSKPKPIASIGVKANDPTVMIIGVAKRISARDENDQANLAKRKGKEMIGGNTAYLNLFMEDDTGEIFCKIDRFDYMRLGKEIVDRGRAGTAIYAVKGRVPANASFKMIIVEQVKYLCDMEQ